MKKMTLLILIASIVLCSCSAGGNMGIIDNDSSIAQKEIEQILDAIQYKDESALSSLFSKNTLGNVNAFDESVVALFDYFEGTVESYDDGAGPFVETKNEDNHSFQLMESSFIVKTTKSEYRFAIQFITQDTATPDNIGIQSLYIIKIDDDVNLEYAYWGDGKFTPGISIGVQNAE